MCHTPVAVRSGLVSIGCRVWFNFDLAFGLFDLFCLQHSLPDVGVFVFRGTCIYDKPISIAGFSKVLK